MIMAQFLVLCLIFINAFVVLAMANEEAHQIGNLHKAEAPVNRKFGMHQPKMVSSNNTTNAFLGPSNAHLDEDKVHSTTESSNSSDHQYDEHSKVGGQEMHPSEHHHHSVDKSVAGGGVILGGLATTFLVAIFCYIKATRRHQEQVSDT